MISRVSNFWFTEYQQMYILKRETKSQNMSSIYVIFIDFHYNAKYIQLNRSVSRKGFPDKLSQALQ